MWYWRGDRELHAKFSWGNLNERDRLEGLPLDQIPVLQSALKIWSKVAHWIKLAQDRYKWYDLVNTVMNIRFARYLWNFLTGWGRGSLSSTLMDEITRVGTLIVATIYLQLIQNRYMFRSFTVLQCSHQYCVQPVASDVEVVGYL